MSAQFPIASVSISCTPHFKPDAEKPWVTRESTTSLHYWFNPEKRQTLIEVVEQIEAWSSYDFEELVKNLENVPSCCFSGYTMNIKHIEIRGVKYNREVLATKTTSESFCNEEPFTVRYRSRRVAPICTIL